MAKGLSDRQFEAMESLMRQVIREESVTKAEFEEKIKHLPTKDEFYEQMAKVSKRLDDIETDHEVLVDRVSTHSDQIEKMEKQLNIAA